YFRKKPGFSPLIRLAETGFLPNLWAATKYFRKNPVSKSSWITIAKKTFDKGVDRLGKAWYGN
ncbi:hypothetical protein, partial [Microcoleus sp. PH2017_22_RUC_O_B]|uniref:hypothetical protein n=1 Tax=Microcoleus sp. PH2017_22_RUC_O_B TaxID=2798833 RepID=UPI0025D98D94